MRMQANRSSFKERAFASLCGAILLHTTLSKCPASLVWCISAPHAKIRYLCGAPVLHMLSSGGYSWLCGAILLHTRACSPICVTCGEAALHTFALPCLLRNVWSDTAPHNLQQMSANLVWCISAPYVIIRHLCGAPVLHALSSGGYSWLCGAIALREIGLMRPLFSLFLGIEELVSSGRSWLAPLLISPNRGKAVSSGWVRKIVLPQLCRGGGFGVEGGTGSTLNPDSGRILVEGGIPAKQG